MGFLMCDLMTLTCYALTTNALSTILAIPQTLVPAAMYDVIYCLHCYVVTGTFKKNNNIMSRWDLAILH